MLTIKNYLWVKIKYAQIFLNNIQRRNIVNKKKTHRSIEANHFKPTHLVDLPRKTDICTNTKSVTLIAVFQSTSSSNALPQKSMLTESRSVVHIYISRA